MKTQLTAAMVLAAAVCGATTPQSGAGPYEKDLRPLFEDRCIQCHGAKGKVKGKVNLLKFKSGADLKARPDLIRDMIDALDAKEMPPEKEPPLPDAERTRTIGRLQQLLHEALSERKTYPRTSMRRMNRFQYANAVGDLLELKVAVFPLPERMMRAHSRYFNPASGQMPQKVRVGNRPLGKSQLIEKRLGGVTPFPQDLRAEHGFDNQADHLSLSPLLMESFLKLGRSVVESKDFGPKTCGIWKPFFVEPRDGDLEAAVRNRLRPFLSRAFRRTVDESTLERYAGFALGQIRSGRSFTEAMKQTVAAVLASPRFLYLFERAGGPQVQRLDDFELASRLSFFLWGSIPDPRLLDLAGRGRLTDPDVLAEETDRMLNDPKLKRFCDSFPVQWLKLDRVVSAVPDPKKFKPFYFHSRYRATMHMALEPLLLFETVLIENRPITELIDARFTYRSTLIEDWVRTGRGKKGSVGVIEFRRVPLTDRREGGVITNAAVMTMTSGTHRTKPITRGAWVTTVIFNNPPKPPPADVPPLPEPKGDLEKLTLRERLDQHRKREDCRGCHAKIDPLGFALENYGPTGVWREKYDNGRTVDSAGVLFRKHGFENIVQFKDALLAEKDRFARGFAKHLLAYGLGREVAAADSPALDRIVEKTRSTQYRLRPLIRQVVLSKPFGHKYNPVEGTLP